MMIDREKTKKKKKIKTEKTEKKRNIQYEIKIV